MCRAACCGANRTLCGDGVLASAAGHSRRGRGVPTKCQVPTRAKLFAHPGRNVGLPRLLWNRQRRLGGRARRGQASRGECASGPFSRRKFELALSRPARFPHVATALAALRHEPRRRAQPPALGPRVTVSQMQLWHSAVVVAVAVAHAACTAVPASVPPDLPRSLPHAAACAALVTTRPNDSTLVTTEPGDSSQILPLPLTFSRTPTNQPTTSRPPSRRPSGSRRCPSC